jgi:ATP-dependent DNA helicase RecQ
LFSDFSFRNNGHVSTTADLGRAVVTGLPADQGKFRVPSLRNMASSDGLASVDLDTLAKQLRRQVNERHVAAAVRVLARAGCLLVEPPSSARAFIRLLATPTRIASELTGERDYERELLRALWRAVGRRIEDGATIDLDGLPPGFGGAIGSLPVLERLQAEQFVQVSRDGGGFRLDPRCVVENWLPVDWDALARRRVVDMDRLDAMQGYAQTRSCRRAFVLRYFGDPDVRPTCGACDRCLGTTSEAPTRAPTVRRTARHA